MITIDHENIADWNAREALLDEAMGFERFLKPSQLLRDGRMPAEGLSLVARDGERLVGTVRMWNVIAGGKRALLLGPIAVSPHCQKSGIGVALMEAAIGGAASRGHGAIILVGDAPYYGRFGFDAAVTKGLVMPCPAGGTPVDPNRFLGLELRLGALVGAFGAVVADGVRWSPEPILTEAMPAALAA